MRVFGIGLGRTGTQSLVAALRVLGFSAIHYPTNLREIDDYQASADITVAKRFRFLDLAYPCAKFILTTRAIDPWLKSCERHYSEAWRQTPLDGLGIVEKTVAEVDYEVYGSWTFDVHLFTEAKARHESAVQQHFANRPDDLLTLDITTTPHRELWQRLIVFLERDPESFDFRQPFPWENRSEPIE